MTRPIDGMSRLGGNFRHKCNGALLLTFAAISASGCGDDSVTPVGTGGSATAGSAGLATAGAGAASGGSATGGVAGSSGTSGSGGSATGGTAAGTGGLGSSGAGAGGAASGSAGEGGTAGTGGTTGTSGTSGNAGAGGSSPTGGASGRAGASGAAGSAGAGGGAAGSENTGANCPAPPMPDFAALPSNPALPDPFKMANGNRITTKAEWRCRRAEIGARIQNYETGTKPAPPQSLTATFTNDQLAVNVSAGSASVRLTSTVTVPSGNGPFPAVIGVGGGTGSLPADIFTSRGIATVTFGYTQLAAQFPNRGSGAFWTLYPDRKAGAMIAWAWGISRIIDGLTQTASMNKIDVSRLAVTGCSFAGKIALYASAFDERIALTIPQESGGGGEAAWRVSQTLSGNVESLSNAQGTAWYHEDLTRFNAAPDKLPFDQHELAAMVAPRALFVLGNPDQTYLASEAGYVSMKAATEVWKALGVADRVGFSQVGGHGHCVNLPSNQVNEVVAFVEKILLGMITNTNVARSPYTTSLTRWIDWQTPALD